MGRTEVLKGEKQNVTNVTKELPDEIMDKEFPELINIINLWSTIVYILTVLP